MMLSEMLLHEFERTAPKTRRHLERVPAAQFGWRPAEKSMTLGQLALHIAASPGGVIQMAMADSSELPDFSEFPAAATVEELLEVHDASVATVRNTLGGASDGQLHGQVSLTKNGLEVMAIPRFDLLRDILLNHTYHHRGQLSVYLRMLGVPVPISFGPTADEAMPMGATN